MIRDPDVANPPDRGRPATTVEDVRQVKDLLTKLSLELGLARDRRQRIGRFRRFALVAWLMELKIGADAVGQHARERAIRARLPDRDRYQLAGIPNDLGVPGWVRAAAIAASTVLYRAGSAAGCRC